MFSSLSQSPSSHEQGFTLIEILLVLVLLAVSSVAVIATLPNFGDDNAKQQAQSFFQRVQLLSEEAILSGRNYGVHVDEKKGKYSLLVLTNEGWQAITSSRMSASVELDQQLTLQMSIGNDIWKNSDRLFKPGSLFDEEMFADVENKKKPLQPQVFILASSESTPFTLHFIPSGSSVDDAGWGVSMDESSLVTLLAPGEVLAEREL